MAHNTVVCIKTFTNPPYIQATPTITWSNPADILYGTASDTQLDATASVPGNCIYIPSSGTYLNVGPQMLKYLFVPTDLIDYNITSAPTTIMS